MNKFQFLFFLFVCISLSAASQSVVSTTLFKNDGTQIEDPDSADYVRILLMPDSGSSLFTIKEFYADGSRKSLGKSNKMFYVEYEGPVISYFENGKKKQFASYHNGNLIDTTYNFYPNGRLYNATYTIPTTKQEDFTAGDDLCIQSMKDSTGKDLVINGNGECVVYDDNFSKVTDSGRVKNGRHDGIWTGVNEELNIKYKETYIKGKLISGESTANNGTVKHYTQVRILPLFPGGMNAFYTYIMKTIRYPEAAQQSNAQGKVYLQFTITEDGSVKNIVVKGGVKNKDLIAEAVRIIRVSPKWKPGLTRGIIANQKINIPISFSLSN